MNELFNRMLSFYSQYQVKNIILYNSKHNKFVKIQSIKLKNRIILIPIDCIHYLNTWTNFNNTFFFFYGDKDYFTLNKTTNTYSIKNIPAKINNYSKYLFIIINDLVFNIINEKVISRNINDVFNMFNNCNLNVHQEGAGNGKTYGIWKSILNSNKETFIILTKQHTAKNVIYQEFKEHIKRRELHILPIENITEYNTEKQYIIKYNKFNKNYMVVIGTIDSFCFNLTFYEQNSTNIFKSILNEIITNGCKKIINNTMKYGNQDIFINGNTDLWIDEAQDLSPDYLLAICSLINETNVNVHIVGDKLQSLEHDINFLTSIENLENVNIFKPFNINRRIKTKNMHNQINNIINFDKYNLPSININHELFSYKNSFQIIESPIIYSNDNDIIKVNNYVDKLLTYLDKEVSLYNYVPSDFMFIFPIMKNNILATELETKLNNYWLKKFDNINYVNKLNDFWKNHILKDFNQYVYLHKYKEGTTINTLESVNSTRIMSIRSSKGDGRKVTFVLNCTETSIKLLSHGEINLIYESYLHVAITRANNKIYFALHENNDDIHRRFGKIGLVKYKPIIKNYINLDDIKRFIECESINLNNFTSSNYVSNNTPFKHSIYKTTCFFTIINLIQEQNNYKFSQLKIVLDKINNIAIIPFIPNKFYTFINEYSKPLDELPFLPLCDLSHKDLYKGYYNIIYDTMIRVQKNNDFPTNIYECFIFNYMISLFTYKHFNPISPSELYKITHLYHKSNIPYDSIKYNCCNLFTNLNEYYDNITWNINKSIEYSGNNYFTLKKNNFYLIGYNDKYVFHIIFKEDINSLNYKDLCIDVLLERFIITNPKENSFFINDKLRYYGKKIKSYIFNMNTDTFINLDLTIDIKENLMFSINNYYKEKTRDIYQYMRQIIDINGLDIIYLISQMKDYPSYIIDFFNEVTIETINIIYSNYNVFKDLIEEKLLLYSSLYIQNL
tara:strand:+ start:156 stop:3029 length:2874 start_codon:yes stop_codon:yes gene_type:complete